MSADESGAQAVMSDLELIAKADEFSQQVHEGHTRKGMLGVPYRVHILEVRRLLEEAGAPAAVIAAGLTHDTIEMGQVELSDVSDHLGDEVANMVVSLTDPHFFKHLDSLDKKRRQAERMKSASKGAQMVKLADGTSNLRSIVDDPPIGWSREKCLAYTEGCKIVADVCRGASPSLYEIFLSAYLKARDTYYGPPA